MAQDLGTNKLVAAISTMVEDFLLEALRGRYEPDLFQKTVYSRLEAFLDGSYAGRDVASLIAYDITELVYKRGDIITLLPAIQKLESDIYEQLRQS